MRRVAPETTSSISKMTGGFALVAYPVSYRNSGVMTFIVNQDGQIYRKGPRSQYRSDSQPDGGI